MSCLLQISDTHFGTEEPPVVDALVRLAHVLAPDAVLLSGDVTQRATRAEFAAARRFVDRLGAKRVLVVPGNHDIPLYDFAHRVFAPYARFRRAFGRELEPCLDSARWLVVALNTTRPWRHVDGEVSAAQVEAVAGRLRQASTAQVRIVVVHQPVAVTDPADARDLLHGHAAAVRRWAEAGADIVMGGHIHLPYVVPLHAPPVGATAAWPRRVWAVQAGTAVSSRVRGGIGNSVNVVRRDAEDGGACTVERWDFSDSVGGFARVRQDRLALGPIDP